MSSSAASVENPVFDLVGEGLGIQLPLINATIGQTLSALAAIGILGWAVVKGAKNIFKS